MEQWILTKYKFEGTSNQEIKYTNFIKLLQDFYDYHFDIYMDTIPSDGYAYTATSLSSLKDEMVNVSKSTYIELIEKKFNDKFDISKNYVLSFHLVSTKELKKYFPDII